MKVVGYRTVNKVNGNYYYGVRTLVRDNDSYLGSGIRLKEAVRKYGKESFIREDLIIFNTFKEALEWERVIITEELLQDPRCYNLKPGGAGGSLPWSEEKKREVVEKGSYKKSNTTKEKISQAQKGKTGSFLGKSHSEESKEKMSKIRKGKQGTFLGKSHSEESKQKMRKPKTEEQKQKIREALKKYHTDRKNGSKV